MQTFVSTVVALAEEASAESAGATPYIIGGGALLILLLALVGLLAFGAGREHS